jgi:hypothetical protein
MYPKSERNERDTGKMIKNDMTYPRQPPKHAAIHRNSMNITLSTKNKNKNNKNVHIYTLELHSYTWHLSHNLLISAVYSTMSSELIRDGNATTKRW